MAQDDRHRLDFLEGRNVLYYAGMDDKALPFRDYARRIGAAFSDHLRYLKMLALLVDNIVIPPTFIASAIRSENHKEQFKRQLSDLFASTTVLTSIHSSMSSTRDFVIFKGEQGSPDEQEMFTQRKEILLDLFDGLPLFQRDVSTQSTGFRNRLISNLYSIGRAVLPDRTKEEIITRLFSIHDSGDVVLSRESFLALLRQMKVHTNPNAYRACYYAMNAAYYDSGASMYFAGISTVKSFEYSILKKSMFAGKNARIMLGYDPTILHSVLRRHGIPDEHLDALTPDDIETIRQTDVFRSFKDSYFALCEIIQHALAEESHIGREKLASTYRKLTEEIERRYNVQRESFLKGFSIGEDYTLALIIGGLGAALGVMIAGPLGAIGGAALGLIPPTMRLAGFSLAEKFVKRIKTGEYDFYLYIELLKERLGTTEK